MRVGITILRWTVTSEFNVKLLCQIFVFHNTHKAVCTLLMAAVDNKCIHIEPLFFKLVYIVLKQHFENTLLVFGRTPLRQENIGLFDVKCSSLFIY